MRYVRSHEDADGPSADRSPPPCQLPGVERRVGRNDLKKRMPYRRQGIIGLPEGDRLLNLEIRSSRFWFGQISRLSSLPGISTTRLE